jgi:hypothetical protein
MCGYGLRTITLMCLDNYEGDMQAIQMNIQGPEAIISKVSAFLVTKCGREILCGASCCGSRVQMK